MTRPFRTEVDEQRYFALRTELFLRVSKSGIPAQLVHEILRTVGKMEDFMLLEGVRQGVMTAVLGSTEEFDALTAHAKLYAGASTPLAAVEMSLDPSCHDQPWGSIAPLTFAPTTLAEAREAVADGVSFDGAEALKATPVVTKLTPLRELPQEAMEDPAAFLADLGIDPDDYDAPLSDPEEVEFQSNMSTVSALLDQARLESERTEPAERPDMIDRLRDAMLALEQPPETWTDLVLALTRQTAIASDVIDQALSTPMGMTAISQAKFFHLHPGAYPR